ncbi:acyl carrier protein [Nocardia bhagyanarayanae]|uniref:Acyl carrier protein n=1 Tax=Nocardia bhagyanarayanae TaxID=1215925 RepID=A0A543F769_9NOCA|nr:acyl carrier protein [Nocardia bhagyanarayanae]
MRPSQPDGRSDTTGNGHTGVRDRRAALTDAAVTAIAELLGVAPAAVSTRTPFAELGLSSTQLARLTARLEDAMGVEVSLEAVYDHPDIEQLAEFLAMR